LGTDFDLAEQYPVYAASALAANSFARSYFAAAFPLGMEHLPNTVRMFADFLIVSEP
jgi:hypothetical protein